MKSVFQFLGEADNSLQSRNTHINHFEDVVFYRGYAGVKSALDLAYKLSKQSSDVLISQKYDGSPTIFFGPAPQSGRFFVSKKGIFNKEPVIYYSQKEIEADKNNKGDLAKKLSFALHFLKELKPTEILQGDLLFTKGDIKTGEVGGKPYLLFHPNTILYGVESDSAQAHSLINAKIGIVLHTKWRGENIEKLTPEYNVLASDYQNTTNVFIIDPSINVKEIGSIDISKLIKKAYDLSKTVKQTLNKISMNAGLSKALEEHHNQLVRRMSTEIGTVVYISSLKKFLQAKYPKLLNNIQEETFKPVIELHKLMVEIKTKIYKHLSKTDSGLKTFIREKDNTTYESDVEGYIVSKNGHYPLKFINRAKFSRFNFDDDNISKGWTKQ